MSRIRVALAAALSLIVGVPASAQTPVPQEPDTPPRVQLGPFAIRPVFTLRDVGLDSNVFNQAEQPDRDFTATVGTKVDVSMRTPRLLGTYSTFYEYMYFARFASERGSNRGVEARGDVLLGRLRPYIGAGVSQTNDRPTAEIDARASRRNTHVTAGLNYTAFSHTNLTAGYRRTRGEFGGDETFRGVNLADALNGTSDTINVGADLELTPLTTVSVHADRSEDRFDASPERDGNSYRAGVTATMKPSALISGRATVGVRAFRPVSSVLEDFTGIIANVSVAYSFRDDTRLNVVADRDLRYSFEQLTPYYISSGARATLTKRIHGHLDGQAFGGFERIAYRARTDAAGDGDTDRVGTFGAGVGYRLGDGARLAINVERTSRSSPTPDRQYARARVYTTLTYGF